MPAEEFFLGVYMTAVGLGELLTRIAIPAGKKDGFAAITLGADGTCIANAAATVNGPCVSRSAASTRCRSSSTADSPDGVADAVRAAGLDPPSDVHASASTGSISPRSSATRAAREAAVAGERERHRQRHDLCARRRAAQAPHPLPPRRPRPNRQPHRLRHGQLRRVLGHLDGVLVKSCMLLAVQANGASIETVEGIADDGELTPLQQSFNEHHALQCGYCTPGMLMSATALLRENPSPSEDEIKKALQGNICRCTGYWNIFEAVKAVAK